MCADGWALVFYSRDGSTNPAKFWPDYGKEVYDDLKMDLQIDEVVKATAARIVGDATTEQDKLARLRDFCLNDIRSISGDWSDVSGEERANWEPNRKPSDTLQSGLGRGRDIQLLYIALANAAGLDARVALVSSRDQRLAFDINFLNPYFLDAFITATNIDGQWVFQDFTNPYIEAGMLRWGQEGVATFIASPKPKDAEWTQTSMSTAERTLTRREGTFDVLEDGTLVGTVVHSYTGHAGIAQKLIYDGLSEQERRNLVAETLMDRLPGAEVSDIGVSNADSADGAFSYSYSIRAPGYAAVTGRRLFVQPNFAKKNVAARFEVSQRRYDVYFDYPWREVDRYVINLPEGFTLESPESPESFRASDIGSYEVQLAQEGNTRMVYQREFNWGEGGVVLFPKTAYPQLKAIFDSQHQADQHVVTATRGEAQ